MRSFINQLLNLSDDLFLEIIYFLGIEERLNLACVNVESSLTWVKKVRQIKLSRGFGQVDEASLEFLTNEGFRKEILNLIHDPYYQLSICEFFPPGKLDNNLVLKSLTTSLSTAWNLLFCDQFRVQQLRLFSDALNQTNVQIAIENLVHSINNREEGCSIDLKELTLTNYSFLSLPVIYGLESLKLEKIGFNPVSPFNVNNLSYLKCLKLVSCPGITDISCLGYIHELSIQYCQGIHDISMLNNNYKISILNCSNIKDFSLSFQFSVYVTLFITSKQPIAFNFDHLKYIHSLCIHGVKKYSFVRSPFTQPLPSSLRYLSLSHCLDFRSLPPNQLREVTISYCPFFASSRNMQHIYRVKLEGLNIEGLRGFGPRNRIFHVVHCNRLKDFSALNGCETIIIEGCELFNHNSYPKSIVENVNHLYLTPFDVAGDYQFNQLNFFNGIPVHLSLPSVPKIFPVASILNSVDSIIVNFFRRSFFLLLRDETNIQKIIIRGLSFQFFLKDHIQGDFSSIFHIELGSNDQETVFTRRNHTTLDT